MASQIETVVTETKIKMSDATALGVFGLALVTFVASSAKLGWTVGPTYVIPWSIMLGAFAQIWAAKVDMKNNSYFGSIVLGAFGLFWMAVSIHWMISLGWFGELPANPDPKPVAFAYLAYFIFSVFITVAALEANKAFAAIMVLIDVLLISLTLSTLKVGADFFAPLGAWSEFFIALIGFYAAGAIFLNGFFGRQVLPLGKPFGLIKKG